ncbi:hypothetical protein [Brachyspira murdochii]|uniref:hypothetical protein n=1 Tax=Brachyspira murdochii TaxID=84378 RepID=UPI0012F51B32|nr:hypothetical protein [Brachyspira murdochii]
MNIKYILLILGVCTSNLFCIYNFNVNGSFIPFNENGLRDDVTDISDISFEDYSMNLSTLGFPMLSTFLIVEKKLPILGIFLELYQFMGYNKDVSTHISYLDFFRTLKTIEYFFVQGSKDLSVSFSYSSTMNVNYNSMIRDLSASYSDLYTDTDILFAVNFYI